MTVSTAAWSGAEKTSMIASCVACKARKDVTFSVSGTAASNMKPRMTPTTMGIKTRPRMKAPSVGHQRSLTRSRERPRALLPLCPSRMRTGTATQKATAR